MNITRRCVCIIAALALVLNMAAIGYAADGSPGYTAAGELKNGQVVLTVSVSGCKAIAGQFAIDFDETKVTLLEKSGASYSPVGQNPTFSSVFTSPNGLAVITPEANKASDLISQNSGYAMFAWYANSNYIDASSQSADICTLVFELKSGVTTDDFDNATFRLKSVQKGEVKGWNSGAYLCANEGARLGEYRDSSVEAVCGVSFSYPGSGVVPVSAQKVDFKVSDTAGTGIRANIRFGPDDYTTDENGLLSIYAGDGVYQYVVYADGYETKTGTVAVSGDSGDVSVALRSDREVADDAALALEIGYSGQNGPSYVTESLTLPYSGDGGTKVTWESSSPGVVSNLGTVNRQSLTVDVILTATITKNSASAKRTFSVKVIGKLDNTADEPSGSDNTQQTQPGQDDGPSGNGQQGTGDIPNPFTDIDGVSWAKEAIVTLAGKGIIKGTSAQTFSPQSNIKRGDFIVLLVRMLNPAAEPDGNFEDVPPGSYYYNEIATAKAAGIAAGVDSQNFNPEGYITRQDMMTLLYRTMLSSGYIQKVDNSGVFESFHDKGSVAGYALDAVRALTFEGYVTGSGGMLYPLNNTTRAETAVVLYRIYTVIS